MKLSANKASKQVGKSVQTITRAIKDGRLSATPLESGGYEIDPAELFRVFPPSTVGGDATPIMEGNGTPLGTPDGRAVLEAKLEASLAMIERLEMEVTDLKDQRDAWQEQAGKLLLNPPANTENSSRGGFWSMFRKSA